MPARQQMVFSIEFRHTGRKMGLGRAENQDNVTRMAVFGLNPTRI
jgi:hypothetical protein